MSEPRVTLIVSTFHSPDKLTCLLYSLKVQTFADFEVLVADNSTEPEMLGRDQAIVAGMRDARFRHCATGPSDCYYAADKLAKEARGDYLAFPSDDNYYVPGFLEVMLRQRADLIYCDMIYDPRYTGTWAQVDVHPTAGHIDKGGFLLRKSQFTRFPADRTWADGLLVEELMGRGVSHAKAPGVLWVHN
jgi:glycosyltransferase involved in cell wall biosynthesis